MALRKLVLAGAVAAMTLGSSGPVSAQDNPVAVIETSLGSMTIELYRDKAPLTVDNFLRYHRRRFPRRNRFPPGDPELHDSGRRSHADPGREGDG